MGNADFNQAINTAVDAGDWALVRTLGEKVVAEGLANDAVLYNLGLAYLKANDLALAVSVLVAIPKSARDKAVDEALIQALSRSGLERSQLELGSHGFKTLLVDVAQVLSPPLLQAITAISLPLFLVAALFAARIDRARKAVLSTWSWGLAAFSASLFGFATVFSLGLTWFSENYQGQWCAVVSSAANIYVQPNQDAEVLRQLQSASPVFAISDVKGPWVHVLHASGTSGWVESLKVRCVDEPK